MPTLWKSGGKNNDVAAGTGKMKDLFDYGS